MREDYMTYIGEREPHMSIMADELEPFSDKETSITNDEPLSDD